MARALDIDGRIWAWLHSLGEDKEGEEDGVFLFSSLRAWLSALWGKHYKGDDITSLIPLLHINKRTESNDNCLKRH